jgi:hypothetical protein
MFKSAFIVMAPDGDPAKHRATIKTSKLEFTTVVFEMDNFDQAVEVAKELVQKEGIESFYLCAGFTHQAVAMVTSAVGGKAAVQVARGDVPSTLMVGGILAREGWIEEG